MRFCRSAHPSLSDLFFEYVLFSSTDRPLNQRPVRFWRDENALGIHRADTRATATTYRDLVDGGPVKALASAGADPALSTMTVEQWLAHYIETVRSETGVSVTVGAVRHRIRAI